MKIWLYFGVRCRFDIIRSHFLFVSAKIGKLRLHVFLLEFLLLTLDVNLHQ